MSKLVHSQLVAAILIASAASLGAQSIALESPNASIGHTGSGRTWSGQIYVATPQLLKALGIKDSQIEPDADFLTARPGLSAVSGLYLTYGGSSNGFGTNGGGPCVNYRVGGPLGWASMMSAELAATFKAVVPRSKGIIQL